MEHPPIIPYPAIARHGVVGDRRTAALIAADGTLDWMCLPDYDGTPVFACLLDADLGKAGAFRLGPARTTQGQQRYLPGTAVLVTTWKEPGGELELTDLMTLPQDDRPPREQPLRTLVRRLRCRAGEVACRLDITVARDLRGPVDAEVGQGGLVYRLGRIGRFARHQDPDQALLRLWLAGRPGLSAAPEAVFALRQGEEVWAVLHLGADETEWSAQRAQAALDQTVATWQAWSASLRCSGPRAEHLRRAAITVHLLTYAPAGSVVAAPTTSLPERIGGDWNADYRFAWVRDASLSLATLAQAGDLKAARRYLEWISRLPEGHHGPLQVLYGVDGRTDLPQDERKDVAGYRGSLPVRLGNHAYKQRQLGSLGYLADCALLYLEEGGEWHDEFWRLIQRIADATARRWHEADNGIWELAKPQHYVSSRVLSWVALDRAARIAERTGHAGAAPPWRAQMERIRDEVMRRGWSDTLGAFRQRYEADNLDASALLIPLFGFLPADHPRVRATIERIDRALAVDGMVYRFDPALTPGVGDQPFMQMEGAFWPCTFWLAACHALTGQRDRAAAVLDHADDLVAPLGLFPEGVDARSGELLGNTPLLFSHAEYVRAARILDQSA